MIKPRRHLVAVPDPEAASSTSHTLYRLGVGSSASGDSFTIGESGPNSQALPWIYLRAGDQTHYELDIHDAELTVTSVHPETGATQAVVYSIDVSEMAKSPIEQGKAVTIIFAYDGELTADETLPIDEWVATTGPRYSEDLQERLGESSDIVKDFEMALDEAKHAQRFGHATRSPRRARRLAEHIARHAAAQEAAQAAALHQIIDLRDEPQVDEGPGLNDIPKLFEDQPDSYWNESKQPKREEVFDLRTPPPRTKDDEPEPVEVPDPALRVVLGGRRWNILGQSVALEDLRDAGYRVAVLELQNGDSATIVLKHESGQPVMDVLTANGMHQLVLTEGSWTAPITVGQSLDVSVERQTEDGRQRRPLRTAPVVILVATGNQLPAHLLGKFPVDDTLARYRMRRAAARIKNGRQRMLAPVSRSLSA